MTSSISSSCEAPGGLVKSSSVGRWLVGLAGIVCAGMAFSQAYPAKPIRIVTSSAGGGNDFVSRLIAQGIAGPLGQPLVVENRANTIVVTDTVLHAPPDGYTIMCGSSSIWTLPLMQKMPYDALRDFT